MAVTEKLVHNQPLWSSVQFEQKVLLKLIAQQWKCYSRMSSLAIPMSCPLWTCQWMASEIIREFECLATSCASFKNGSSLGIITRGRSEDFESLSIIRQKMMLFYDHDYIIQMLWMKAAMKPPSNDPPITSAGKCLLSRMRLVAISNAKPIGSNDKTETIL